MIASLTGVLSEKTENWLVIRVGGVGYRVFVPLSTYADLSPEGARVTLRVYTHVRDEAIHLFGFLTLAERKAFELLLGVNNVGPKLALAVLSGLRPEALAVAVTSGDTAALSAVNGVGKRTAERIIVELRDRLGELEPPPTAIPVAKEGPGADLLIDTCSALVNLGYRKGLAEAAVGRAWEQARDRGQQPGLQDLLKGALAVLARGKSWS